MNNIAIVDQDAWDIGQLIQRLTAEYNIHMAAIHVAADPRAADLMPAIEPGELVPVLRIPRGDGTDQKFHALHYLEQLREPNRLEDFNRSWLMGTLITVGDRLGAVGYFGHQPEAELVRHLRNGVAHGNRFRFDKPVRDPANGRLKYPAHNKRYAASLFMRTYEIDTHLHDQPVLYDFGGPAVILDILQMLSWHLIRQAQGIPPDIA